MPFTVFTCDEESENLRNYLVRNNIPYQEKEGQQVVTGNTNNNVDHDPEKTPDREELGPNQPQPPPPPFMPDKHHSTERLFVDNPQQQQQQQQPPQSPPPLPRRHSMSSMTLGIRKGNNDQSADEMLRSDTIGRYYLANPTGKTAFSSAASASGEKFTNKTRLGPANTGKTLCSSAEDDEKGDEICYSDEGGKDRSINGNDDDDDDDDTYEDHDDDDDDSGTIPTRSLYTSSLPDTPDSRPHVSTAPAGGGSSQQHGRQAAVQHQQQHHRSSSALSALSPVWMRQQQQQQKKMKMKLRLETQQREQEQERQELRRLFMKSSSSGSVGTNFDRDGDSSSSSSNHDHRFLSCGVTTYTNSTGQLAAEHRIARTTIDLPNGQPMAIGAVTRMLLRGTQHRCESVANGKRLYYFRGQEGMDLWQIFFFDDPTTTDPAALTAFGQSLIRHGVIHNYTPDCSNFAATFLVLQPLLEPRVLNSFLQWRPPAAVVTPMTMTMTGSIAGTPPPHPVQPEHSHDDHDRNSNNGNNDKENSEITSNDDNNNNNCGASAGGHNSGSSSSNNNSRSSQTFEQDDDDDPMDVILRLSRLMDDVCATANDAVRTGAAQPQLESSPMFHAFEEAACQLQVIDFPDHPLEKVTFALNLFNLIVRHAMIVADRAPHEDGGWWTETTWPRHIQDVPDYFADIGYCIAGDWISLADLQGSLYGQSGQSLPPLVYSRHENENQHQHQHRGYYYSGPSTTSLFRWDRFLSCCSSLDAVLPNDFDHHDHHHRGAFGAGTTSEQQQQQQHCLYYQHPVIGTDPRLLMACTWGTRSSPKASTVYPNRLNEGLQTAAEVYCREHIRIVSENKKRSNRRHSRLQTPHSYHGSNGNDGNINMNNSSSSSSNRLMVVLPALLSWHRMDFDGPTPQDVLHMCLPYLSVEQLRLLQEIRNSNPNGSIPVVFDDQYDWTRGLPLPKKRATAAAAQLPRPLLSSSPPTTAMGLLSKAMQSSTHQQQAQQQAQRTRHNRQGPTADHATSLGSALRGDLSRHRSHRNHPRLLEEESDYGSRVHHDNNKKVSACGRSSDGSYYDNNSKNNNKSRRGGNFQLRVGGSSSHHQRPGAGGGALSGVQRFLLRQQPSLGESQLFAPRGVASSGHQQQQHSGGIQKRGGDSPHQDTTERHANFDDDLDYYQHRRLCRNNKKLNNSHDDEDEGRSFFESVVSEITYGSEFKDLVRQESYRRLVMHRHGGATISGSCKSWQQQVSE